MQGVEQAGVVRQCRIEAGQSYRLVARSDGAVLVEPADDGEDARPCAAPGEALAAAHQADDERRLADARGKPSLAQAVFAVKILAQQIAKRMAHAQSAPT
jgi:hypothetical protein